MRFGVPDPDTGEIDNVDLELKWDAERLYVEVDNLELQYEEDGLTLRTIGDDYTYDINLPGHREREEGEEPPTCPNYYCYNYTHRCDKHDEKGNSV